MIFCVRLNRITWLCQRSLLRALLPSDFILSFSHSDRHFIAPQGVPVAVLSSLGVTYLPIKRKFERAKLNKEASIVHFPLTMQVALLTLPKRGRGSSIIAELNTTLLQRDNNLRLGRESKSLKSKSIVWDSPEVAKMASFLAEVVSRCRF